MPEAIPLCASSCQTSHANQDRGSPETPAAGRNATGCGPSRVGRESVPRNANAPLLGGISFSNARPDQHPRPLQA